MGKWSAQYTGRLKGIDFKFFRLDPKYPAWPDLFSAMASFCFRLRDFQT